MYKDKKILAVTPARGGSLRLPRKNIRPVLGKPLIAWTIEQAKKSGYIDRLIVSTDDEEIAKVAGSFGAEVPFLRPKELADSKAKTVDVLCHALSYFRERGMKYDYLVLLETTSPLREVEDIDRCIEILIDHPSAKSIVTVARPESAHPEFTVIRDEETGFLRKIYGTENFKAMGDRHKLLDVFFFEGTVYISKVETLLAEKTFYHDFTLGYVVPRWKSLEVDELPDLISAEALLKARLEGLF